MDNVYTSETAGTWTVTGSYETLTDTAELTVMDEIYLPFVTKNFTP
jgi:hypothetical protein